MSADKRPGGLTALAVVNFILGCLALLGAVGLAMLPMLEQASVNLNEQQLAQVEAVTRIGTTVLSVMAVANLLSGALLIASGIGFLKLKRFLGRTVGNASAVYSIAVTIGGVFWLPATIGGGFNIMVVLSLLFAALTLFLLNVTFKEDLVK